MLRGSDSASGCWLRAEVVPAADFWAIARITFSSPAAPSPSRHDDIFKSRDRLRPCEASCAKNFTVSLWTSAVNASEEQMLSSVSRAQS